MTAHSDSEVFHHESERVALFNALMRKYKEDMSLLDVVVCRELFSNWIDEHPAHHEQIVARLVDQTLGSLPPNSWPQFILEAREYGGWDDCVDNLSDAHEMIHQCVAEKGSTDAMNNLKLFRVPKDVLRAIDQANRKGFVEYQLSLWGLAEYPGPCEKFIWLPTVDVKLRGDIFETLKDIWESSSSSSSSSSDGHDHNYDRRISN